MSAKCQGERLSCNTGTSTPWLSVRQLIVCFHGHTLFNEPNIIPVSNARVTSLKRCRAACRIRAKASKPNKQPPAKPVEHLAEIVSQPVKSLGKAPSAPK